MPPPHNFKAHRRPFQIPRRPQLKQSDQGPWMSLLRVHAGGQVTQLTVGLTDQLTRSRTSRRAFALAGTEETLAVEIWLLLVIVFLALCTVSTKNKYKLR